MNLLNVALGGLTGALTGSPFTAITGIPIASLLAQKSTVSPGSSPAVPTRDSVISDLPDISSAVNLLGQAAGSQASDASLEPQLNVPPLPPMPAPKSAPAVPTDDHGQSNVVFSSSESDGSLIH